MLGLPRNTFILCTVAIALVGSFSRFTHGRYIPRFYAYQEYHQVDDGSLVAKIVPVLDLILAVMALWRRTRIFAIVIIDLFMIMGLFIQINAGKRFELDLITVILASLAVIEAS